MDANKLVKMANQIAEFFAGEPERTAAVDGVALHLQRFWEPRMRKAMYAALDAGEVQGMHELVATVLRERRNALEPVRC